MDPRSDPGATGRRRWGQRPALLRRLAGPVVVVASVAATLAAAVGATPVAALGATSARASGGEIHLRLIGQVELPTGTRFEDTEVGGLSGIDRLPDGRFVAISDDRGDPGSRRGLPRFYTLALDYDEHAFRSVRLLGHTLLRQPDGQPITEPRSVDPEDIRLLPNGHLAWSSEGVWHADPARRHAPFVREMRLDGSPVRSFALPALFDLVDQRTRGGRENKLIEALAVTPGGTLFAANEDALLPDGPAASATHGAWLRLVAFDLATGRPGAQYVYPLPPIPSAGLLGDRTGADNGLVALLALDEQRLIAVERAWVLGVGNTIRLAEVRITPQTTDVRDVAALAGARFQPLERRVLLEMPPRWQGLRIDNIEGITWGHRLANGRRSLVLVSDNNFNRLQTTQFIALEVDER